MKIKFRDGKEIIAPPKFDKYKPKKSDREKEVKEKKEYGGAFYLTWFIVFVFLFIILALGARIIFLFEKSTFNSNSYSVLLSSQQAKILVIEKTIPEFTLIKLPQNSGNKLNQSLNYGIPIDAQIVTSINGNFSWGDVFRVIFQPWNYRYTDMTAIDHIKLLLAVLKLQGDEIKKYEISINKENDLAGITQNELYDVFKDPQIISEGYSISVVNATDLSGLGGRVAQIIKNTGGNVVSISSEDKRETSMIMSSEYSVTLQRLKRILGLKSEIKKNSSQISDIKIILGEDFEKRI